MSGRISGLSTCIKEPSHTSVYIHCYNPKLNLVVQKIGIGIPEYQSVLGLMQWVHNMVSPSNHRQYWFSEH